MVTVLAVAALSVMAFKADADGSAQLYARAEQRIRVENLASTNKLNLREAMSTHTSADPASALPQQTVCNEAGKVQQRIHDLAGGALKSSLGAPISAEYANAEDRAAKVDEKSIERYRDLCMYTLVNTRFNAPLYSVQHDPVYVLSGAAGCEIATFCLKQSSSGNLAPLLKGVVVAAQQAYDDHKSMECVVNRTVCSAQLAYDKRRVEFYQSQYDAVTKGDINAMHNRQSYDELQAAATTLTKTVQTIDPKYTDADDYIGAQIASTETAVKSQLLAK